MILGRLPISKIPPPSFPLPCLVFSLRSTALSTKGKERDRNFPISVPGPSENRRLPCASCSLGGPLCPSHRLKLPTRVCSSVTADLTRHRYYFFSGGRPSLFFNILSPYAFALVLSLAALVRASCGRVPFILFSFPIFVFF